MQIETEKIFYSFIDLFLQHNAYIFEFKSVFRNQKCSFKNPKKCPFDSILSIFKSGQNSEIIHYTNFLLFINCFNLNTKIGKTDIASERDLIQR